MTLRTLTENDDYWTGAIARAGHGGNCQVDVERLYYPWRREYSVVLRIHIPREQPDLWINARDVYTVRLDVECEEAAPSEDIQAPLRKAEQEPAFLGAVLFLLESQIDKHRRGARAYYSKHAIIPR